MIINENQLSSAHNVLSTTKLKIKQQQKHPPLNNRPKWLLLKAISYLSIGHSNNTSCEGRDDNSVLFQAKIIKHENCQEENKMIEQGFNYADSTIKEMTDFIETRVENLEPKEDMKKFSVASKKAKKTLKKRIREASDSSVVESSDESTKARHPTRKYCILHGKCSHSTDNCKDLRAMVNKHKRKKKKRKNFKKYGKSNIELNALIEKKISKNC